MDGHDFDAMVELFTRLKADKGGKPHAVIATTTKGKGVSFMEDKADWHGKAPNAEQLAVALEDLGAAPDRILQPLSPAVPDDSVAPAEVPKAPSGRPSFASAEVAAQKKATRAGYGETLAALADEGLPIVALDADLSGSNLCM